MQPSENVERLIRRVPWGLEIQIWQLTNTITIPESAAGAIGVSSLLDPVPPDRDPRPVTKFDDDDTIDLAVEPSAFSKSSGSE